MKMDKKEIYAVITGDIVGSRRFKGEKRKMLYAAMKEAANLSLEFFGDEFVLGIDIFRGDSWQCLLNNPRLCLRVGLFYRATLNALVDDGKADSRIAIAVGKVDFFPKDRASEGDGEAYRLSGRLLEKMPGDRRVAFSICGEESLIETKAISVVACFVDCLAQGWTGRQALAISGALRNMSQKEIAESWFPRPITQQAVAQHLDRAHWRTLREGLAFIEEILEQTYTSI